MAPLTVSLLPDLTISQSQKFIAVNDTVAKLEGLAVKYSRSEIITTIPGSAVEGRAYLVNTTFGSVTPGNFVVFTKPSNSSSVTLVPQIYRGLPGMTLGGYTLDTAGTTWVVSTDPAWWGNNTDNLPVGTHFIAVGVNISITGTSVLYTNGTITPYPVLLPPGSYRLIKTPTNTFLKT